MNFIVYKSDPNADKGEGVEKSENFADIINGSSLTLILLLFAMGTFHDECRRRRSSFAWARRRMDCCFQPEAAALPKWAGKDATNCILSSSLLPLA